MLSLVLSLMLSFALSFVLPKKLSYVELTLELYLLRSLSVYTPQADTITICAGQTCTSTQSSSFWLRFSSSKQQIHKNLLITLPLRYPSTVMKPVTPSCNDNSLHLCISNQRVSDWSSSSSGLQVIFKWSSGGLEVVLRWYLSSFHVGLVKTVLSLVLSYSSIAPYLYSYPGCFQMLVL